MDVDDLLEGDIARRDVGTDAAAVDERDIRVELRSVRIRAEVAEVGFMVADRTFARLRVLDGQQVIGVRNDCVQQRCELFLDRRDERIGFRIVLNLLGCREELKIERAVRRDCQLADVGELRAGLAVENVFAVLILNDCVDDGMAVAVDERVKAAHIRDDFGSGPRLGLLIDAHMADCDDVIRAFSLRRVDRCLYRSIDAFAGRILAEAVDVFGVIFVHEVRRGGLGDGFRRGDTDECDLLAVRFEDLVGVQSMFICPKIHEVCGNVRIVCHADELEHTGHAVVKFVVAERCEVVADLVHDLDDRFAAGEGADRAALYVVARVNEDDFVACFLKRLLQACNACIAPTVADAAMYVVREQNDRIAGRFNGFNGLCSLRKELEGVDVLLGLLEAVDGHVVLIELKVLRLRAAVGSGVDRGVALDVETVFCGIKLEQRVGCIRVVEFNELDVVRIGVQILAVCSLERVLVRCVVSGGVDFHRQKHSCFGNGQTVIGRMRPALMPA